MAAEDPLAPVALGCCSGRCGELAAPPDPRAAARCRPRGVRASSALLPSPLRLSLPAGNGETYLPCRRPPSPALEETDWSFKPKPKLPGVTGHFITLTF